MSDTYEQLYETRDDREVNQPKTTAYPKPNPEDTDMFKQQVSEWLKLDDQVRKLTCATRERKLHQKALAEKIQQFMSMHGFDDLNTAQGVIKHNVRTVKQPVKILDVRMKLEDLVLKQESASSEPMTYKQLFDSIFEAERPTVVKQSLRRRIPKVSLNLDL
jgi:hypothetical protein